MKPKIRHIEFGNIKIDDEVFGRDDFILFWNGFERSEKTHNPALDEFHDILLKDPEIVIFGTGFSNLVIISDAIKKDAEKNNIELIIMPTPEAIEQFKELLKKGKRVVARIHTTC